MASSTTSVRTIPTSRSSAPMRSRWRAPLASGPCMIPSVTRTTTTAKLSSTSSPARRSRILTFRLDIPTSHGQSRRFLVRLNQEKRCDSMGIGREECDNDTLMGGTGVDSLSHVFQSFALDYRQKTSSAPAWISDSNYSQGREDISFLVRRVLYEHEFLNGHKLLILLRERK